MLVALLARELGAGARGQFVAAVCTSVSGFALVAGHLQSTTTFDLLAWTAVVLLVARILATGDDRLWLAIGGVTGVALQNKPLPLLLVLALALGFALDRRLLEVLRSPWLFAGAALAAAIWLPNLLWQAAHGWPQLELAAEAVLRRSVVALPARSGAFVVEGWLRSRARSVVLGAAVVLTAAVSVPLALPIVPAARLHSTPIADVNEDAIETIGWPELVRTTAHVYEALPAPQRATAVVFTGNYGEAGAIDRFGAAYGLPRAFSGHNAYARFGMPPGSAGPVIILGFAGPAAAFVDCRQAATIDNGVELENEEQGGAVFVCARPRRPWREIWPALSHLDA